MNILIVADDPGIRKHVSRALSGFHGYEIETAESALDGLRRILEGNISLVIANWVMEGMTGVNLCRTVRSSDLPDYVYIILLGPRGGVDSLVEGLAAGADEVIPKPVDPAELNARIRNIQRLKNLHDKVASQRDQLQTVQKLKENWISMIVHDLRTPMSVILAYSDMLVSKPRPEAKKWLATMRNEALRVNNMLEQMILMAKSEEGELRPSRTRTDLRALAAQAMECALATALARSVSVEFTCPESSVLVHVDPSMMRRVLDNLLDNAIRYSPDEGEVSVGLRFDGEQAVLEVSDHGPGIPDELRDSIFDKYVTLDLKHEGKAQHGLGLTFCRTVLEANGGTIACLPNDPSGTRFEVRLARTSESSGTTRADDGPDAVARAS